MERRKFIQTCAVVVGSTVLPMGCGSSDGGSDEAPGSSDSSPRNLARGRWTSLDDNNFSVAHDTYGAIDMQLTSVDEEMYDPVTDQFSIVLTGPELPLLDEGVYPVYNSAFGYIDLFLQPGESSPGVQTYRSMFSLLQA